MPKKYINYSNTLIYKIVCNDINVEDLYVGSTTDFTRRKYTHKNACINPLNGSYNLKIYKIIRDNGYWINWTMVEIEKYPCSDSNEAHARERHWYEILKASLNSNKPIIYRDELIKYRKEYQKEYKKNNEEVLKEYQKEYKKNNEEVLKEYQKEYQKEYKKHNEEVLKEYQKEYKRDAALIKKSLIFELETK